MSFAYLPLWTGDYLRDTRHLAPMEHGIYLLLLMHCWDSRGAVPLDERKLEGITNVRSDDERAALHRVLADFFERTDAGYVNARMAREVERAAVIGDARRGAARARWDARAAAPAAPAQHEQSTSNANASASDAPSDAVTAKPAKRMQLQSKTSTPVFIHQRVIPTEVASERETRANARTTPLRKVNDADATARGSRLAPDATLPDLWGAWCRAERPDLDAARVFDAFRDYWIAQPGQRGVKVDWFATWRNWCRNQRASPAAASGNGRARGEPEWSAARRARSAAFAGPAADRAGREPQQTIIDIEPTGALPHGTT